MANAAAAWSLAAVKILYCIPEEGACGVTRKVTVNTVPEPEMVLRLQSIVRKPFESVVACPGVQTSFVPSIVNRLGTTR